MLKLLCSLLLIYFALGTLLFVLQRTFIYFPSNAIAHGYPELEFANQGEVIKAIVVNGGQKKALLYFGGNAETVAFNAVDFKQAFPNYSVYLVNYRGYGGSSGSPSEQGLYSDALAIYDQLSQSHSSISVIGRSLGSGIASYLAAKRDISHLVLVTPFDSIEAVAQAQFPIYPMKYLLKDKYDSAARSKDIKAKVLLVIAEHDRVIRRIRSEQLLRAYTGLKPGVELIKNADHNDIAQYPKYYQVIQAFLK
ncbi:alpha/beta hydrolase [Thalassomonas haliotis]|uniref:Alpha/beta fold hydrolase n=1 Tax=Thalassomonas haliotis TaxID=485448 RepID=A0ABY7VI54_9GAMM|nr:alpha/beta fold hydrolase [Thalassomonas haliotis]WDE12715.1 alpha/beta fold hydrolase [Thalassomonas haliotis]